MNLNDDYNYTSEIIKTISKNKAKIQKSWENSSDLDISTKHVIIENLLPKKLVDNIYEAFPKKR